MEGTPQARREGDPVGTCGDVLERRNSPGATAGSGVKTPEAES